MYCKYCGKLIEDDSKYCSSCGKQLSQISNTNNKLPKVRSLINLKKERPITDALENEFDLTYHTNTIYVACGICYLLIMICVNTIIIQSDGYDNQLFYGFNFVMFIIKILFSVSIATEARKVKRNSNLWSTLVFFFTGIALIIYGLKREKLLPDDFQNFSDNDKSKFLEEYAYKLAKGGKYKLAESLINRALEFDKNSISAYDVRAFVKYYLMDYGSALKDANYAIEMDENKGQYYYHRGYILHKLNDSIAACQNWKKALELGHKEAKKSIELYCTKR